MKEVLILIAIFISFVLVGKLFRFIKGTLKVVAKDHHSVCPKCKIEGNLYKDKTSRKQDDTFLIKGKSPEGYLVVGKCPNKNCRAFLVYDSLEGKMLDKFIPYF